MESRIQPWQTLRILAHNQDQRELEDYLDRLEPRDAVRAILRLNSEDQEKVLTTLSPADAADLIEDIPDEQAAEIIESLEPKDAAPIVAEMRSDEQADLLADLDIGDAEAILERFEPGEAKEARELASYADDVAGGLMVTEYLSYSESVTVQEVLADLNARSGEIEDYFKRYAYVVSPWDRLIGVVEIQELAFSSHDKLLGEILGPSLFVLADAPLDELKKTFDSETFAAVPVVNNHGRLLGVVRRSAVTEALTARSDREMLRMKGIVGGDEIRTLPMLTRSRRRLSWLSINILLNIVAASVIAVYIDTLSAVIALAVFLPIISDMSGCTGNQAVAVSMRELALGIVKPFEALRVLWKELLVGLINGVALGLLLGVVAWAWQANPYLGLVVGGALALNTLIAVSIGGTVPLLLKRFGVDPALASGPVLTTVTDICGFFLVLSFATLMMPRLD